MKTTIAKKAAALLCLAGLLSGQAVSAAVTLNGAGATFPYPIYSKWFDEYHKAKPEVQINYQSIGSGGGIRQITARTVDFGATDGPMTKQQLFAADGSILHIPTVLGGVAVIYNVMGVSQSLKLDGSTLADIFLGKVKSWDDPAIKALNLDVNLPGAPIVVVHRSDGSGTTYCFVDYLSKVSDEWKKKVGVNTAVNWPTGLGGKGNEGVSGLVKQTPNSIGYVEVIYAKQNSLSYAAIKNAAGKYIEPNLETITAAAAGAEMPADFRVSIVNAAGEDAYPISTFTWLLVYEKTGGQKAQLIKDFLQWMLDKGQAIAPDLGYAPLPEKVESMVRGTIEKIK